MGTAKTSHEVEQAFIATAKACTGKSLEEWIAIVQDVGTRERSVLLEFLKGVHGLDHLQAQLVAGIFLNGGEPVYGSNNRLRPQS